MILLLTLVFDPLSFFSSQSFKISHSTMASTLDRQREKNGKVLEEIHTGIYRMKLDEICHKPRGKTLLSIEAVCRVHVASVCHLV